MSARTRNVKGVPQWDDKGCPLGRANISPPLSGAKRPQLSRQNLIPYKMGKINKSLRSVCELVIYVKYTNSKKSGFVLKLIRFMIILIAINMPWNKLGLRIKNIVIIEFEHVDKTQENSEKLTDLQQQIDEMKMKISRKRETK